MDLNSVWRQASVAAAALGQFVGDIGGFDALDDGNVANFATSFERSIQNGKMNSAVAGGSVNVFTATLTPAPAALTTSMEIVVNFGTANTTTTPTLNVNALGAKTIVKQNAAAVAAGDVTGYMPLIYDGTNWRINGLAVSDIANSGLIQVAPRNIVPFLASTTWTCPATTTRVRAKVWAGGGGAGGAGDTTAVAGAPGGGSGEYREGTFTVVPGTVYTITIGAGGAGGTSAPTSGGNGGTSSFDAFCSAIGGTGSTGVLNTVSGTLAGGGTGGSGGQIALAGNGGGQAIQYAATTVGGGIGGAPGFGRGINSPNINGPGSAGNFPGSGGTGGASVVTSTGNAGGAGGAGYIILEY
jgi:hypothetical protein